MRHIVSPPASETELLDRCDALAGRTLAEVARVRQVSVPRDLLRNKGWIGQLVESVLGATAQSQAIPDFPELGVELKTLPLSPDGRPLQSTYVCTAPLDGSLPTQWSASWVRSKLSRVLWVPIIGTSEVPVAERVVGAPLMWSPSEEEDEGLGQDYTELSGLIARGEFWQLNARRGNWLQIRPKGAKDDLVWALDDQGEWMRDVPRGFYLRTAFTRRMIAANFAL